MNKKQGISLIVLVITIIVMIILAASVVITLSNTGIINKANKAVSDTNLKEVEQLASLTWAEEYMNGKRGAVLKTAVLSALDSYKEQYNIEVTDSGVNVTKKEEEDEEWVNDPSTSNIKFRQPYVIYETLKNGETAEQAIVFYEEGVATMFLNGAHGQTEAYPVCEVEYCKNKLRLYIIGIPKEEGYQEYTIASDGSSISTQTYASSSEGDYYKTLQADLVTLEELTYDIILDIDVTARKLSGDFCIFSSGDSSEETDSETGETYRITEVHMGYMPNVYPEYFEEMTNYSPVLKELEFAGILKVYFDKETLTLMERDDYGTWDEENYILTLTSEELKNRTTEIYYKFKSKDNGTGTMYYDTSVGYIMYKY